MKRKVLALSLGLFALFGLLILQFFKLQIIEQEKWSKLASRQHFFILKEPFHRGTFYSNTSLKKGHPETAQKFVIDIEKFHLFIDPESIPEAYKKAMIAYLWDKLGIKKEARRRFAADFFKKSRSRRLAMWLTKEDKEAILAWWNPFAKGHKIPLNALFFASDYQRSYPFGKLLGQVLHTTQSLKDENTLQDLPTGGLELYYNSVLQGRIGKKRLMRSPRNHLETGDVLQLPENGADIWLTINHNLQAIAEEEVMKGVKNCKAKSGWAVMMDPKTGEILALAQYPFFDPSHYAEYYKNPLLMEATKIKAVTDANEPGSVMKPLNLAIALLGNRERPFFNPEEKIDTSKGRFKGRSKPVTDTHHRNALNMNMAIQKSSNVYLAHIVDKIIATFGCDWYRKQLVECFGVGKKTGIELPGESRGMLPMPGKKHPSGALEWSLGTPISMAMGYNLQLNTLQILRAHAVIANRGLLVEPTLIRKIVKGGEVLVDHTGPERIASFPRVLPEEVCERVIQAMKYTTKPGGTARRGDVWGYTEAGKTSTSHKIVDGTYSSSAYIANFVGFTPVKNPSFVLIVTMDEPESNFIPGIGKTHHGGNACAPVFREIAHRSLEYLGVPMDDPHGFPMQDPRFNKQKADWFPETIRLQEIYETWNKK